MRSLKSSVIFAFTLLGFTLFSGCEHSTRFESLPEMKEVMNKEGFHFAGKFGDEWPAELLESRDGHDGIAFDAPGMGRQSYPNYKGYDFRLLLLKSDRGKDFAIVFKKKR